MILRKLTARETAQICPCGLFPSEHGHAHTCRHWRDREITRLRTRIAALEVQLALLVTPAAHGRRIPIVFDDRPAWRCTTCNQTTHARSVRNPDRCIRCAAHEVAA